MRAGVGSEGDPERGENGAPPPADLSGEPHLRGCRTTEYEGAKRPFVGRIALLSRLGRGGMGVVYHGVNPRLGNEVAVKILPWAAHIEERGLVDRFVREARLAATLKSEHLVGVLDVDQDEDSGNHFLVMEYVRGKSAGAWRRAVVAGGSQGVPEDAALDVCIAATKGLAAAHLAGVVHRDIKPDNILIPADAAGRLEFAKAKLADLGLARPEVSDQSLTGTEHALGTPGYMAPEQAQDAKRAKKPADVFAMGATLYALLAGRAPFAAATPTNALLRTIQGTHEPLTQVRADVSPATAALVDHCLEKDPAKRYSDAPALLEALQLCRAALSDADAGSADAISLVSRLVQAPERGERVKTDPSGRPHERTASDAPRTESEGSGRAESTPPETVPRAPTVAETEPPRRTGTWALVGAVVLVAAVVVGAVVANRPGEKASPPVSPPAAPPADAKTPERPRVIDLGKLSVSGGAPGAKVTLARRGGPPKHYDFALDGSGALASTDVETGTYAVEATADGFDSFTGDVEIASARPTSLAVTMREHAAPTSDDLTRRRILTDLAAWDAASSANRRAAAELVASRNPAFALMKLETFSCGGQTHEVAIYSHAATGLEFVLVPGGTFQMGSPANEENHGSDETQHRVTLSRPFLIARTECTQAAYEKVVGGDPSDFKGAARPVETVSWDDAKTFCDRAELALPTEAQWEYACRAGTTGGFCNGASDGSLGDVAWYDANSGATTHPVGGKKPNAFGLHDMPGNVCEWCADHYDADYGSIASTDPTGPAAASRRVNRGGEWYGFAKDSRSAMRGRLPPGTKCRFLGFRPARVVTIE